MCALAKHTGQTFEIITGRDAKLANKVLRCRFQVAIVISTASRRFIFWTAEVCIGTDGRGTFKALEPRLGFGLNGRVEGALAEELVGGYGLLVTKFVSGVFLVIVWATVNR